MDLKNKFKIRELKTKQPSIKVFVIYFLFGFLCTTFIKDRMLATLFWNICGIGYLLKYISFKPDYQGLNKELINKFSVISLFVLWYFGQMTALGVINYFGDDAFKRYQATMSDNVLLAVVVALFLAPIMEELLFRGVVYNVLKKYFKHISVAIVLQAIIFSCMHGTLVHGLPTFFLGVLSCYVYELTGNIKRSIGLHFLFNFLSVVMVKLIPEWLVIHSPILLIIFTVALLTVIGIFLSNIDSVKELIKK